MLKDKVIHVFDTDNFKREDFITFCYTQFNDIGEREEGRWINGIIDEIDEYAINVVTTGGVVHIDLDDVIKDIIRIKQWAY